MSVRRSSAVMYCSPERQPARATVPDVSYDPAMWSRQQSKASEPCETLWARSPFAEPAARTEIQMSEIKDALNGKVAFISGGAGAIGSATARRLALDGARVVIGDLPGSNVHEMAASLQREGLDVAAQELDLEQEASIHAAIEAIGRKYGRLDGLE